MTEPRYLASNLIDLPAPAFVAVPSWQATSAAMLQALQNISADSYYLLPSDPAIKVLDIAADQHVKLLQRINEVGLVGMIAHARGADLDNLGATYFETYRLVVDDTDTQNVIHETDTAYRRRIELSPEAQNTAGAEGSYEFHALSASGLVKDARAYSPSPAHVVLYLLSLEDATAIPSPDLLDTVTTHVSGALVRPAGDVVTVEAAAVVRYALTAVLTCYHGTVESAALAAAELGFAAYRAKSEHIGHGVTESGAMQALHQPGVYRVELFPTVNDEPVVFPIGAGEFEAAICDNLTLTIGATA